MAKFQTTTRVIRNAGPRRTLCLPSTTKSVGRLPTESGVEYLGLLEMAFDKDIKSLKVQPIRFELTVDSKTATYTPDVEYVRRSGVVGYREFKHSIRKLDEAETALLTAASHQISALGFEYTVRDLEQISSGYRIENIKLLRRYCCVDCPAGFASDALRFAEQHPGLTFQDLREWAGQTRLPAVMRLLWDQRLGFEMTGQRLGPSTRMYLGEAS
jgi:hypothetical protein